MLIQEFRLLLLGLGELFVAPFNVASSSASFLSLSSMLPCGFLDRDSGTLKLDLLSHLVADVLFGGVSLTSSPDIGHG
ncbi:hypothetical protein NKJ36_33240 [Mesorhizobium sp. M0142]|uniref:hypothetical protein n=1 Tax=unclassified Mesorhizobium TaxID=325217 RepID=UPI00333D4606